MGPSPLAHVDPARVREVVSGWPPMLWFRDGTVETCALPEFTLDAWCGLHGVPHTDRHDPLALLCEPFLDTEFTADDAARSGRQLEALGFTLGDIETLRAELRGPMLSYNALIWDWVHLGLYDVVMALPGPAAETAAWCSRLITRAWEHQGAVPMRPLVGDKPALPLSAVLAEAAGSALRDGWTARRDHLRAVVVGAYQEPHRRYHTLRHLEEAWAIGSASLNAQRGTEDERRIFAWAVLFHDLVYVPGRGDNEELSAARCEAEMARAGEDSGFREQVVMLIRWSKGHDRSGTTTRAHRAFFDADLGILGLAPARYAEYAAQVREVFVGAGIAPEAFDGGRRRFLETLATELDAAPPYFFGLDPLHVDLARRNVRGELAGQVRGSA